MLEFLTAVYPVQLGRIADGIVDPPGVYRVASQRLDLAVLGASGIRIHCWADAALRQAFHARNYLGLSENSVPLHPMVNDHYPY